jgi:hypothetical protein
MNIELNHKLKKMNNKIDEQIKSEFNGELNHK